MKTLRKKNGFTLVELLAVIVVLAIVTVLATRSVLPYMQNARPDVFRVEATNVIESADNAVKFENLGEIDVKNNTASCKNGRVYCFTIEELINLALYDGSADTYKGKVIIDATDTVKPKYTLYLQKGAEFSIVGGTETDYVNNGTINDGGFTSGDVSSYTTCSCS